MACGQTEPQIVFYLLGCSQMFGSEHPEAGCVLGPLSQASHLSLSFIYTFCSFKLLLMPFDFAF